MSERWRRELRRVRQLGPPEDLWERVERGPSRPEAGPRIARGVVLSVALILVLSAVGYLTWTAFRPSSSPGPVTHRTSTPAGYYIAFPQSITALTNDPNGGAAVVLSTNLPDGTKVMVHDTETGDGGAGFGCCDEVQGGQLRVKVNDTSCYNPLGQDRSAGFVLTLTVTPSIDSGRFGDCPGGCKPVPQPQPVLDVLGAHFENLTGDQVTTVDGQRALVATAHYDWPEGVCDANVAAEQPDVCPAANGEPISEVSPPEAAADLVGVFLQARLCELWGAATPEFQQANPWSSFRDRVNGWLQGLGPLVSPDGQQTFLVREIVGQSPETFTGYHGMTLPVSFTARYLYKGTPVGEAEFVNVEPRASHIVTQWRVSRVDLS
jgi:hypothetical protein